MKTLFLFVFLFSFLNFANAAKDFDFDVPYLTQEEFVNLYEADQREYIILFRQAAADLSYEDQLSFFQRFNFTAPVWAVLLGTEARSEEHTEAEIIAKINSARAQANALVNPVKPGLTTRARAAISRFGEELAFGSDSSFLVARDSREVRAQKVRIAAAFKTRNDAMAMVSNVQIGQGPLRAKLRETDEIFDRLFHKTLAEHDNKRFRETIRDYKRAYESFFNQPMPGVVAPRRGVLATVLDRPVPPAPVVPAAAPGLCVRCIYGGFVISGNTKCEPVKSGAQMTAQLGNLNFPPPVNAESAACSGSKPVMCNPLIFGTRSQVPVCVPVSASATRSCTAAAGTSPESINSTKWMIENNGAAFNKYVGNLRNICKNTGTQCYSAARRNDIRQTCGAIRERIASFRDKMRVYSSESAAPAPAGGRGPRGTGVRQLR